MVVKGSNKVLVLHIPEEDLAVKSPLPEDGTIWDSRVTDWWDEIWSSPISTMWLKSDIHGLYRLALLVNTYFNIMSLGDPRNQGPKYMAAIKVAEDSFGLNPLSRFRLKWEEQRTEAPDRPSRTRKDKRNYDPRRNTGS